MKRFTRAQAVKHLRKLGYKIAKQTLANREVMGTGPKWHSVGWTWGYYEQDSLEAWAEKHARRKTG